ncbi:MAG: MoaD/ThiS family protein [Leptospiraceae bacterium]|nr:MoaD/ThiS family protein [Leptospiraceae bacterium]
MDITVKTFAGFKELLGSEFTVSVAEPATIGDLSKKIVDISPESERLLAISAFVVSDSVVDKGYRLLESSLVYLLPPCSGG